MFQIIVKKDGVEQGRVALSESVATIGRAETNQIVLAEDSVSRRHARFLVEGNSLFVEDLRSGNGTFVGGSQIEGRHQLHHADEVRITPFSLTVEAPNQVEEPTSSQDIRTVMIPAVGQPPGEVTDPAQTGAKLILRRGEASKSSYQLSGPTCTIGRSEDRDVILTDPASSRRHATVHFEGNHYVVRDEGSANGVIVNNVTVRESGINHGDRLIIGETEFEFVWPGAPVVPSAGGFGAMPPPAGQDGDVDPYSETGIMPAYGNWPGQVGAPAQPMMGYGTELGSPTATKKSKLPLIAVIGLVVIGLLAGINAVMNKGQEAAPEVAQGSRDMCAAYGDTCPDPTDQTCLQCQNKRARMARGQELFIQKEFGQAIAEFQRILQEIDPLDNKAIRFRYIAYEFWTLTEMEETLRDRSQSAAQKLAKMQEDFNKAEDLYKRYARRYGANASEATLARARSHLNSAVSKFNAVMKIKLDEPEADKLREQAEDLKGKCLYSINRLTKHKKEKSEQAFVQNIQELYEEAEALKASGGLIKAEAKFREVIKADPGNKTQYPAQAKNEIAAIKEKLKERAIPILNVAIRKMRNQQWVEARVKLQAALDIDPGLTEAKERLKEVEEECHSAAKKLYSEARIQYNVNQYGQAEKLLQQVIRFVPDKNDNLNQKAQKMMREMGRN